MRTTMMTTLWKTTPVSFDTGYPKTGYTSRLLPILNRLNYLADRLNIKNKRLLLFTLTQGRLLGKEESTEINYPRHLVLGSLINDP